MADDPIARLEIPPVPRQALHQTVAIAIRAAPARAYALCADWRGWPRLFPRTIREVRRVEEAQGVKRIDVQHVEGPVPNLLRLSPPDELLLYERKRRYDAWFRYRFEPDGPGTRFVVEGEVLLRGRLRLLAPLLGGIVRRQLRRFVLEPVKRAAERNVGAPASSRGEAGQRSPEARM